MYVYAPAEFTDRYVTRRRDWQRSYSGNCQKRRRCSSFYSLATFFFLLLRSFFFFETEKDSMEGRKQSLSTKQRHTNRELLCSINVHVQTPIYSRFRQPLDFPSGRVSSRICFPFGSSRGREPIAFTTAGFEKKKLQCGNRRFI